MNRTMLIRLGAALALASLPFQARPQPVAMPTMALDPPLSIDAALDLEYHSNIFRIADGPADTVARALLGLRFEREFSLQRISLNAFITPVKYFEQSSYDYLGYGVAATWDIEFGRPVFGQIALRFARDQTPFDVIGLAQNNLLDLRMARGLAGWRITQAWAVIGAIDTWASDNSLDSQKQADYTRNGLEAGVRYLPGGALELDMVWRRETANYPNRQVTDSVGNLLPAAVDNAYAQDTPLARVSYRPSDATRITGLAGYTRRRYENLPQRDFSGVTGGFDAEWPATAAFLLRGSILRSIEVVELTSANYIDVRSINIRPVWQMSGRTALEPLVGVAGRRYLGDPGFVVSGSPVRVDRLREAGLRLRYDLGRRTVAHLEYRYLSRNSNYPVNDFKDHWVGIGVRASF
jgi:hypothetical protein